MYVQHKELTNYVGIAYIMTVGERIRILRESKNLSTTDLARMTGMDQSQISRFETGRYKQIKADQIKKIAKALEVPVSTLLDEDGEPAAKPAKKTYCIREVRVRLGLSQAKLAAKARMKAPTLARYENGSRTPSDEDIASIAKALGVTIDDLASDAADNVGKKQPKSLKPETIGQRVRRLMAEKDLNSVQVGEAIGVSASNVNKLRNGVSGSFGFEPMMKLAELLGVTPYELLGQKPPEKPKRPEKPKLQQTLPLEVPRARESSEREEPLPAIDPERAKRLAEIQGYARNIAPLSQVINASEWRSRQVVDYLERHQSVLEDLASRDAKMSIEIVNLVDLAFGMLGILEDLVRFPERREALLPRIRSLRG